MRYDPDEHTWVPWSIDQLRQKMSGCEARWWLSGGMAIEHGVGRRIRLHDDLDISVSPPDLAAVLAQLHDHVAWAAAHGELERLLDREPGEPIDSVWIGDAAGSEFLLQINVELASESRWHYRRCPDVTAPWDAAVVRVRGIPTGSLATQLLWKSKDPRRKDYQDLEAAAPLLSDADRSWLFAAVTRAHPTSPWRDLVRP